MVCIVCEKGYGGVKSKCMVMCVVWWRGGRVQRERLCQDTYL